MANNNSNAKRKQELEAEQPFGTESFPLGGIDPDLPRPASSPAFDPEGRVAESERRNALLDDTEPSVPGTYDLGTSAEVTQISTSPNSYIVEASGEPFTFTGDIEQFLREHNVTDITYTEPSS